MDPRTTLFREGLAFVSRLTGKPEAGARALLGKLLKGARDDCAGLLEVLREAHRMRPADPVPWLLRAAEACGARQGVAAAAPDPDDPWGIQGWCRALGFQPTVTENDRAAGKWIAHGWVIDGAAEDVAEAAGLPESWRGDWSPLLGWAADGLFLGDPYAVIRERAEAASSPITSLRYFDAAVRNIRRAQ